MNFSIIELYLSESSNVFIIWGQNEYDDFFLIDNKNRIYGFFSLDDIKYFLNGNDIESVSFNKEELLNYKHLFSNEINSYSIKKVHNVLLKNTKIEDLGSNDAGLLIEVYNLISDYFYQTKNEECLELRMNNNMEFFFEYCYYKYFWQIDNKLLELEKKLPSFNYSEFINIYKKLTNVFIKSIKIVRM